MNEPTRTDAAEAAHLGDVDAHPDVHRATEPDEGQVLEGLYGPACDGGIHHGHAEAEVEQDAEAT